MGHDDRCYIMIIDIGSSSFLFPMALFDVVQKGRMMTEESNNSKVIFSYFRFRTPNIWESW